VLIVASIRRTQQNLSQRDGEWESAIRRRDGQAIRSVVALLNAFAGPCPLLLPQRWRIDRQAEQHDRP
jgi:hypothetical protein